MKITKQHMLLYAVTDRSHLGDQSLEEAVEEILSAGATLLQLREKHLGEQAFLEQAQRSAHHQRQCLGGGAIRGGWRAHRAGRYGHSKGAADARAG